VSEYTAHFDRCRALRASGLGNIDVMKYPEVRAAVQARLIEHEGRMALTAEYVRKYIEDVLEVSICDYFAPAANGRWATSLEGLRELPQHVKRLIEELTVVQSGDTTIVQVKFVSKTAALHMATKYTLTAGRDAGPAPTLPWERIAEAVEAPERRTVEERLAEVEA
jgi:hypothetical protein